MISLDAYPKNTLEGLIARALISMICEIEDHQINLEPITEVISKSRELMRTAGWSAIYQHDFLVRLGNDLTALTHGPPVTRQFVQLLEIETEFD